jgi:hypothetical protein
MLAGCADGLGSGAVGDPAGMAAALPAMAAGFHRHGTAGRDGGAVVVDYTAPAASAAARVWLHGPDAAPVPADPASPAQRTAFDQAISELAATAPGRTGRQFRERERAVWPMPAGHGMACATLAGSLGRESARQLVCVGGARGRLLRVQVTMLERGAGIDGHAFVTAIVAAARGG